VERLFQKDSDLRQAQVTDFFNHYAPANQKKYCSKAVVDWLEANARDDIDESLVNYFTHSTTGWENTLGTLLQKG